MLLDGDKLVGFGIVLPDLNPLVQKLNGRLSLWGKLRLLYAAKFAPVRKVRAMVIGIAQPYQLKTAELRHSLADLHQPGEAHALRYGRFFPHPRKLAPLDQGDQAFGGQHYKTFRVFEREI